MSEMNMHRCQSHFLKHYRILFRFCPKGFSSSVLKSRVNYKHFCSEVCIKNDLLTFGLSVFKRRLHCIRVRSERNDGSSNSRGKTSHSKSQNPPDMHTNDSFLNPLKNCRYGDTGTLGCSIHILSCIRFSICIKFLKFLDVIVCVGCCRSPCFSVNKLLS